jgi:hypothetical protein
MPRRFKKTLIDYLVIAISPALIMLMVGSLVFFLIEVFYQGSFTGRLVYIFALFVMAAVLVARISIEEGRERALLFAIPLAVAILLTINRFVQFQGGLQSFSFFINLGLIAVVWWSADKLTWDCTLIDEDEEDTGEGLLEAVGLEKSSKDSLQQELAPLPGVPEATTSRDKPPSWWQRFIERRRRPHAPGVWVIYFSLAALPLFGLGQLFIPVTDLPARQIAFNLLFVYTASGLGLLLATSFLGLRRYLRQRRQEMPLAIVSLWLIVGGVLILGVMLAAMLLPRPNAEYAISELPLRIGSPDQNASPYGQGNDGVEDNQPAAQTEEKQDEQSGTGSPDRPGNKPSEKADRADNVARTRRVPSADGEKADKADNSASQKAGSDKADSKDTTRQKQEKPPPKATGSSPGSKQSPQTARQQRQGGNSSTNTIPHARPLPQISFAPVDSLAALCKWLFYGALILFAAYAAWRNRAELLAALSNLGQWLADFWHSLFGGRVRGGDESDDEQAHAQRAKPRPFSDFADPFAAGTAARRSPAELVRYTFEALEAWALEHGRPRQSDETPHEFARGLAAKFSTLGDDARRLADLYCQAAYTKDALPTVGVARLSQLWQNLRAQSAVSTVTT